MDCQNSFAQYKSGLLLLMLKSLLWDPWLIGENSPCFWSFNGLLYLGREEHAPWQNRRVVRTWFVCKQIELLSVSSNILTGFPGQDEQGNNILSMFLSFLVPLLSSFYVFSLPFPYTFIFPFFINAKHQKKSWRSNLFKSSFLIIVISIFWKINLQ